jgi:hypothetical protein
MSSVESRSDFVTTVSPEQTLHRPSAQVDCPSAHDTQSASFDTSEPQGSTAPSEEHGQPACPGAHETVVPVPTTTDVTGSSCSAGVEHAEPRPHPSNDARIGPTEVNIR